MGYRSTPNIILKVSSDISRPRPGGDRYFEVAVVPLKFVRWRYIIIIFIQIQSIVVHIIDYGIVSMRADSDRSIINNAST